MNPEQNNAADTPQTTIPAPLSLEEIKKQKQRESNRRSYYKHQKERIEQTREYYKNVTAERNKQKNHNPQKPGPKRMEFNQLE